MKHTVKTLPQESKPIPSLPSYYATPGGSIYRVGENIIKLSDNTRSNSGYKMVQPYKNGKRKLRYVHQLVLEAFKGPRPEGLVCDHINRNRLDNHIDNLRYVTVKENLDNRGEFNRPKTYEQHIIPLYFDNLDKIGLLRKNGIKPAVIADMLQIPVKAVYYASRYL